MSVELIKIINSELLTEVKSHHLNGIYSADDFVKQIKPEEIFFHVTAGQGGIGRVIGPYKLIRLKNSGGRSTLKKCEYDVLYDNYRPQNGLLEELFHYGQACFKDKNEAKAYYLELGKFENKIFKGIL